MNLSASEMQQMCRHLGHTQRVHLTHYRAMSPYIERVTLGKILLMQDLNIQAKFVGKSLSDVDFIDIVREQEQGQIEVGEQADINEASASQGPSTEDPSMDDNVYQFTDDVDANMDCDSDQDLDRAQERKRKKPVKRQPWSTNEMTELKKYFAKHLADKVAPRKNDCDKAKRASFKCGGELHKRPWSLIVKKVSAMNHTKKK
jgi:hypothetical protein